MVCCGLLVACQNDSLRDDTTWALDDEIAEPAMQDEQPANDPDASDTTVSAQLIDTTWTSRSITAALCNDTWVSWTFDSPDIVWRDVLSQHYNDDEAGCEETSSRQEGTFTLEPDGVMTLRFDDDSEHSWSVARATGIPLQQADSSFVASDKELLSTRAFYSTSSAPDFYETQFSGPYSSTERRDYHRISFQAPLGTGDCVAQAGARILFEPEQDNLTGSTELWDVPCHIVDTGLDGWHAIIVDGEQWEAPSDATPAQRVRATYSQPGRAMWFYHEDHTNIIFSRYTGDLDPSSGWMELK